MTTRTLQCSHGFAMELLAAPDVPIHRQDVTADLGDLLDEAYVRGVLADRLPADGAPDRIVVCPIWRHEPVVGAVEVRMEARGRTDWVVPFTSGRWTRRADDLVAEMHSSGALAADTRPRAQLLALSGRPADSRFSVPPLQAPLIAEQSLDDLGIRSIAPGVLDPERPVLVNRVMLDDVLAATERSGISETGGGTLGKIVRLPEPLPGTTTRIVTLLTASVVDERHRGAPGRFTFNPEALAEAAELARLRGLDEQVVTAWHSHGWGTGCDDCNVSERCALPQCTLVSNDDYHVAETLLPGKATVLPIAGRKLGAEGRRPVLELHAWRGGALAPIAWLAYDD